MSRPQIVAEIEVEDEALNVSARRREQEKLEQLSRENDELLEEEQEESKFFNLSLYDLGEQIASSLVDTLDDLLKARSLGDISNAFFNDNRLIFTGLTLVIIGIIISIILITTNGRDK